ncbi:hypothetical protein E9993_23050, partial [Labilibacter sediminis]
MDSTSKIAQINQEMDAVIGTSTRIPRLYDADGFDEWKWRFPQFIKRTEPKMWRSFVRGPTRITLPRGEKEPIDAPLKDKDVGEYTEEDWEKVEADDKAFATITMALAPDIAQGFRQYTTAKSLWEALLEVYEGNEDMKESRQDSLRQKFNLFNHILGETLEAQLQRFTTLNTQMSDAGII